MAGIPDLYVPTCRNLKVKSSGILALCAVLHSTLVIATDTIMVQRTTTKGHSDTTAGPSSVHTLCPGVDFLMSQSNRSSTFLQLNVSDCEDPGVEHTAHQGVVYGVCADLTTFCTLHLQAPRGRSVRAFVQRLVYWCGSKRWKTTIQLSSTPFFHTTLKCNEHSLQEMFFDSGILNWMIIEHINSPPFNIITEIMKTSNFVVKHTKEHCGYLISPYTYAYAKHLNFFAEWKLPMQTVMMFSVQQSYDYVYYTSLLPSAIEARYFAKVTYSTPNKTQHNFVTMSLVRPVAADVLHASYLKISFFRGYEIFDYSKRLLKMYVSSLSRQKQRIKLFHDLFNCSVHDYDGWRQHVDCNLKVQCEGGQDETELCVFSSPHCQGLVASHHKCFQVLYRTRLNTAAALIYECYKKGGRLASVKTRQEQVDMKHCFDNVHKFEVNVGSRSGWHSVPFFYSMFRVWSDNTMIYQIHHFTEEGRYSPSRRVLFGSVNSMRFQTEGPFRGLLLCEVVLQPAVFSTHTSLAYSQPSQPALTCTQQLLFVCQEGHVTHWILSYAFSCSKVKASAYLAVSNFSHAQDVDLFVPKRFIQTWDTMYRCDDGDTTPVHHTLLCDFREDCPDGSDESFCEHPSCPGFLCSNMQCVLTSQRCNQYSDCLDDSDEFKCPDDPRHLAWFKGGERKQMVYLNLDGTGYFTQQVMSADQPCPDSHYQCKTESPYCLPVYTRCNGFSDCVYGEDEQGCDTAVCPGFYQCRSSLVCVHGDDLCDGWGQCPQRDDDWLCDLVCPENCVCQGHAFLCRKPFLSELYPYLRYLDAPQTNMSLLDFKRNAYLVHLKLPQCSIYNISYHEFPNVRHIDLAHNHLQTISLDFLARLSHLRTLRLENNPLSKITSEKRHNILHTLRKIELSKTQINVFNNNVSLFLPEGKFLNISFCAINMIGPAGLKAIPQLTELDVRGNPLTSFPGDLLLRSDKLERIFTSNFRLCCQNILPQNEINCVTPNVALPSCTALLPAELHRVFFWLLSITALAGNVLCFIASSVVTKVLDVSFVKLIAQLQTADMCMGSHVIIIVSANEALYGNYILSEKAWTNSVLCKLAGFLFLLARIIPGLVILSTSVHHVLVLCFPAQLWRVNTHRTSAACVVMWMAGFLLAAVPLVPGLSHWGLQGQSGLCRLALFDSVLDPDRQLFKWLLVMEIINCIWGVMIVSGLAVSFTRLPQNRVALSPIQRSAFSSVHVVRQLAVMHALCWIPFMLATVVGSFDVGVFDLVYDAIVVFVLPLPSAVNPLLYLWTVRTQWQRQQQEEKLIEVLKNRMAQARKHSGGK